MFGNNPILKPISGDGQQLDIHSIFPTIQGEGPYTGWPAIFIRLSGCNLACQFCDTEFDDSKTLSVTEIVKQVDELSNNPKQLIVLTGGEPFRQPIELLCQTLLNLNYKIQIETNGMLYRPINSAVDIICSPKNTGTGYHPIRADLRKHINAFKFLISANNPDYNHLPESDPSNDNIPIYIQPMDEYDEVKNKQNLTLTLKLVQEHGYKLSLQTHKILGIP